MKSPILGWGEYFLPGNKAPIKCIATFLGLINPPISISRYLGDHLCKWVIRSIIGR
jgi:hypothetical protein